MELRALLHLCNNPKCKDEPGSEADARREGNEVIVQCRTCPNHGEYSVDLFDDESFDPIHEALGWTIHGDLSVHPARTNDLMRHKKAVTMWFNGLGNQCDKLKVQL